MAAFFEAERLLTTLLAEKWLSAARSFSAVMDVPQARAGERGMRLPAKAEEAKASATVTWASIVNWDLS